MEAVKIKVLTMGLLGLVMVLALALSSCATVTETGPEPGAKVPEITVYPPYKGPKKRIAVSKFGASGAFTAVYGGWDIGGGLAAQLTTELVNSGRFIVVERAALADVLTEQEMALQKIVAKETAAKVGRVLGAQLLIRGEVTEFEQEAGGGGSQVGIGGLPVGGLLGFQTTSAQVAMDLRLVDTTTGQVLQSRRSEGKASQWGVAAEISTSEVSFGGDAFKKTPLGIATRQAIRDAVMLIIERMEKLPWTGRVVDVIDGKVYVNAGSTANIRVGDMFVVSTIVKELIDPETQQVLGVIEDKLGEIRVESVQEKFSIATIVGDFRPKKGDILKYKPGGQGPRLS